MKPNDYEFIVNPDRPARRQSLPGSNSLLARILVVCGGIFILIILFVIVKSLLSSGSVIPTYIGLTQDQQSMIHIATNASQEKSLTSSNQNFALTAQLSLTSDQSNMIKYIGLSGGKVKPKTLILKVSPTLDNQLLEAAAASSYNRTFSQIMQTKLSNYEKALQRAYTKTKGPKGRELLSEQYKEAQLLTKMLEAANR